MDKLGIEPTLLLGQIVNFFIIMFVLGKLLYKPILKMLEKRKHEIEEGLRLTESMRQEEEKLQEKKQKFLEAARKEGQGIIEEMRKQAKVEEKEIVDEAHKQAEQIIAKAHLDIEHARAAMEKEVRASAVELAVAMAKRLMTNVLSSEDKHKLIGKNLKELESVRAQ